MAGHQSVNILLIDHTARTVGVVGELLQRISGYQVDIVTNIDQGVQQACEVRPALILLNFIKDQSIGFELCRQIKSQRELEQIPLLFVLPSESDQQQITQVFTAGGVDYIPYPPVPEVLMARVSVHIALYQRMQQLELLQQWDEESGFYSQNLFQPQLQQMVLEGEVLSLLLIQLSREEGKHVSAPLCREVLIQSASRIRQCVKYSEKLYRIGETCFAVVLDGALQTLDEPIAGYLLERLAEPMQIDEYTLQFRVDIGIARFPDHAQCATSLIRRAEQAQEWVSHLKQSGYLLFDPARLLQLSCTTGYRGTRNVDQVA